MAKTIWDVVGKIGENGSLPSGELYEWATRQADRSEAYHKGELKGTSITDPERKKKMLERIREAYESRSESQMIDETVDIFEARLEDPGLLDNFEYFDIPSSDFMLNFYLTLWAFKIAEVMDYCHNYGRDLKGQKRKVPEDDVWFQMSRFEAMNVDARKKAQSTVEFIKQKPIEKATSFGGGNIPERFYGLPKDLLLTVFDDGNSAPLEELFPDAYERKRVNYLHEKLSSAPGHHELLGTQDLVWMTGVSMYLKPQELVGAILCGAALLRPFGYMRYDSLVWTESMRRVIRPQGWPYDPKNPMVIYSDAPTAIESGRKTVAAVNEVLAKKGGTMVLLDPELTFVDPWGVTSVRFTIQKMPL